MSISRIVTLAVLCAALAVAQAPAPGPSVPVSRGSSIGATGPSVPVAPNIFGAGGFAVPTMPNGSIGALGPSVPLSPNFNATGLAALQAFGSTANLEVGAQAPVLPGGINPYILDPFAAVRLGSATSQPAAQGPVFTYTGLGTGPAPVYPVFVLVPVLPQRPAAAPRPAPPAGGQIVEAGSKPFVPAAPTIYGDQITSQP